MNGPNGTGMGTSPEHDRSEQGGQVSDAEAADGHNEPGDEYEPL